MKNKKAMTAFEWFFRTALGIVVLVILSYAIYYLTNKLGLW